MAARDKKRVYSIDGTTLEFVFRHGRVASLLAPVLEGLACLRPPSGRPSRKIIVEVWQKSLPVPSRFQPLMRSSVHDTEALVYGDTLIFTDKKTQFLLQPDRERAAIFVDTRSGPSLERVVIAGLLELLRAKGFYPLHASAVSDGRSCLLLLGNSGCGKSTVTLGLLLRGWRFLSDDLVLLKGRSGKVDALAASTTLKFRAGLFGRQLGALRRLVSYRQGEAVIDVQEAFPRRCLLRASPSAMVFLVISAAKSSALVRLPRQQAFFRLIKQSASLFLGGRPSQGQLELLKKCATGMAAFELSLGKDLHKDPLGVAEIMTLSTSSRT